MEIFICSSFWASLIGDMWNVHLAFMGFLISMMTLLYTSLSGKVEELNSIKQSEEYTLMNRATAMHNSIERLRYLNKRVMIGLVISFCLFVLTTIIKYLSEGCMSKWIAAFIAFFTFVFFICGIKLTYDIYSQYQKETF